MNALTNCQVCKIQFGNSNNKEITFQNANEGKDHVHECVSLNQKGGHKKMEHFAVLITFHSLLKPDNLLGVLSTQ